MSKDIKRWYDEKYHYSEDVAATQWERIYRLLDLVPAGKNWLDLGGGTGTATVAASDRGRVTGKAVVLDLSIQALRTGRQIWPHLVMVQGNGEDLPFGDAAFDRVFCFGVLEHFPDVERGAREIARVLTPQGLAVVIVPNWWVRTAQSDIQELSQSEAKWKDLFAKAGLETVRVGDDRGPDILKNRSLLGIAKRLAVRTAGILGVKYQFAFVLKKPKEEV